MLHVVPYYEDAWAYGGIPRATSALAAALSARGHAVTVVTTDACEAGRRCRRGIADRDGVTVGTFPNLSNTLAYHLQLFAPIGLGTWLQRHARQFDVAHLHACRHLPGALAARALARAGVPWVLTPHGPAPLIERRRAAKRLFDRIVGRRALRDAAAIVAATEAERDELIREGIDRERLHVVPPPVDLDPFATPIARGRARAALAVGTAPLVVYLGKLTPRKRLDVLVEAFGRLRHAGAKLVIAGNDMGAGRAIARDVTRRGLGDRTRFTGLLTGRARLELLADADVVAYASEREIFGLVPLESLLAGSPVVVANDSGAGEVVTGVGGGLVVPPGAADALATALDAILADGVRWRAAARDASERVRQRYAPDRVARETTRLYESLLVRSAMVPA